MRSLSYGGIVTAKQLSVGLHGATWTALVVALIGALATPRNYCYYVGAPHPTPEIVVMAALVVAFVTVVSAVFVTAARGGTSAKGSSASLARRLR